MHFPEPITATLPKVPPAPSDISALINEYTTHTPDLKAGWMYYLPNDFAESKGGSVDGATIALKR